MVLLKGKYGDLLPGKSRIGCLVVFAMIYPCNTGREDALLMWNMTVASHGRRYRAVCPLEGLFESKYREGKDSDEGHQILTESTVAPMVCPLLGICTKCTKNVFCHTKYNIPSGTIITLVVSIDSDVAPTRPDGGKK